MNHPPDMMRQGQGISHLSGSMMNPQHFPQPGQQLQPSTSQQSHTMNMAPNGQNPNPQMSMGSQQPGMPTPAQMYEQHHYMQQRRAQNLLAATQNAPMNANSANQQHMNGLNPNMNYPASMMQPQGQGIRRVASQSQGLNQAGLNHMGGMHSAQPSLGGMGAQPMPHNNMRMQPQPPMNGRMPQQQQPPPQMQGHISPEMSMAMNQRPSQMQPNPGMPPRAQLSQPPPMGNIPQQPQSQTHPIGMPPQMHRVNYSTPPQMGQSPHPGSHPQSQQSGNISMQQPMNDGAPNRALRTPDNSMYMSYPNQQFPQGMPQTNRPNNNPNQFGFHSASTPPDHDMGSGLPNGFQRPGIHLTPSQQLQMQRNSGDINASHFHMPSSQAPPRPPSLNPQSQPMQSQPSSQSSQHSPEHMHMNVNGSVPHLQRPQSQPDMQGGPVRPPSQQAGSSRTPHMNHQPLPGMQQPVRIPPSVPGGGGGPNGSGLGPQLGPPQPPQLPPSQQPGIGAPQPGPGTYSVGIPRPPSIPVTAPGSTGPTAPNAEASSSQIANTSPPKYAMMPPAIGMGQGVVRLLAFSAILATENPSKLQLSYWDTLIKEYFTQKAVMKYTLWKDNQRNEAKPFEIGVPILPRFFLVTSQSGVKAMSITLDGVRERLVAPGHAVVECVSAVWTYKYNNGYTIHLRGPLTAHVWQQPATQPTPGNNGYTLKFEHLQFDANYHDKYITIESIAGQRIGKSPHLRNPPTPMMNGMGSQQQQQQQADGKDDRIHFERSSLPGEPVNAFGVPQATMRCLELAESVAQMTDLIQFSTENDLGPLQSLKQFAKKIRDSQGLRMMGGANPVGAPGFPKDVSFGVNKGMPLGPSSVTLYQGTPSSMPIPNHMPMGPSTPQNAPPSGDISSPSKQNKAPPQPSSSAPVATTPATTPASTAPNTTPSLAAATLKRKAQGDISSPTTDNPPPKRTTRKRRTTGGGG